MDGQGRVFVADRGNHRVQVFASDGRFLAKWGGFGTDPGKFNGPYGIAVDGGQRLRCRDAGQRVQKFRLLPLSADDTPTSVPATAQPTAVAANFAAFFWQTRAAPAIR